MMRRVNVVRAPWMNKGRFTHLCSAAIPPLYNLDSSNQLTVSYMHEYRFVGVVKDDTTLTVPQNQGVVGMNLQWMCDPSFIHPRCANRNKKSIFFTQRYYITLE